MELVSVDVEVGTEVDLSEFPPNRTNRRIINITATPIKYGISFLPLIPVGLMV